MKLLGFISAFLIISASAIAQDTIEGNITDPTDNIGNQSTVDFAIVTDRHSPDILAPSPNDSEMLIIDNKASNAHLADIRLKKNVTRIDHILDKLAMINAVKFDWKNEPNSNKSDTGRHIGLIAQEVEQAFPELVTKSDKGYKTVDYEKFTAVLLEAVKELKAENVILKHRLDNLELR